MPRFDSCHFLSNSWCSFCPLLCIFCAEEFHQPIILVLKKAVLEQLTTKLLRFKEVYSRTLKRVALLGKNNLRDQFCWPWESQWTNFDTWLWNGMMELVDMPGMSPICRICRLGTFNPKHAGGVFRGLFCVPTEGVPKIWFDGFSYMGGGQPRKKLLSSFNCCRARSVLCLCARIQIPSYSMGTQYFMQSANLFRHLSLQYVYVHAWAVWCWTNWTITQSMFWALYPRMELALKLMNKIDPVNRILQ